MKVWTNAVVVIGLAALAVLAHYLGAEELALALVGGALGYATQPRRVAS